VFEDCILLYLEAGCKSNVYKTVYMFICGLYRDYIFHTFNKTKRHNACEADRLQVPIFPGTCNPMFTGRLAK